MMLLEREADIIGRIAKMLVKETAPFSDGSLLHSEAESNMVYAGIFRDEGDVVKYVDIRTRISYEILNLWDAADPKRKWSGLVMTIEGDSFNARFEYAEDWNPEEWESDRLDRLLAEKYGNKKIVYPDIDDDDLPLRGRD